MDRNHFVIDDTAAEGAQDLAQRAICPGCHTPHPSLTGQGLAAGVGWKCARCGQRWDARRLASVAAYERWVADRSTLERSLDTAR
jgi:hypothetical protein